MLAVPGKQHVDLGEYIVEKMTDSKPCCMPIEKSAFPTG